MHRLSVFAFLALVPSLVALGHEELPDGEIERGVQVIVKADALVVQYFIGMNEATLREQLKEHELKVADTVEGMWKQYQDVLLPSLPKKLVVTSDKSPCALKPIRGEYFGWKHRHLMCVLEANIHLSQQPTAIVLTDRNFFDAPGSYRIAIKGRSGTIMSNSSVPPVLLRAKPSNWMELNKQQKEAAARAEAEFSLHDRDSKDAESTHGEP